MDIALTKNSPLVQNLFRKRDLLAANDERHKEIRTVLLILGGGMRGVSGGGSSIALHLLGLGNVFDAVIGISAGAPIGAYFLAGQEQAILGTSMYYQDLSRRFIRYRRTPIVDIDFLEGLFRKGEKQLDVDAVLASRSDFFVGATRYRDAAGTLIDAKQAVPDLITALKASSALPGLYGKPVLVNGERFVDGGMGMTFPITEIIEQFQPTDVLVLANHRIKKGAIMSRTLGEKFFGYLVRRGMPDSLKEAATTRHIRYQEGLATLLSLAQRGVNAEIVPAPEGVSLLTRDARKLKQAAHDSVQMTLEAFGQPNIQFKLP